ncbi:MAG: MFS transporter [Salibacteraceae bacterium]
MDNIKKTHNPLGIGSLILAGEGIFLLPFVIPRIFRPTLLHSLEITNLELGTCFSIYGIVAMISYFFGGPLADRLSSKTLISAALILTGVGGFVLMINPSVIILYILYGYWGFTTIFLFWAALIKATRNWGGDHFQGRAFGWLEAGRGTVGAIIGTVGIAILSQATVGSVEGSTSASFQSIVLFTSIIVIAIGLISWFGIPKDDENSLHRETINFNTVERLLVMPNIWLLGLIIVCAYVGYKVTDDLSLYANTVLGLSELESSYVSGGALWLRPVFALIAGYLADKLSGGKVILFCFGLMALGSLMLGFGSGLGFVPVIFIMVFTIMGIYGLRGIYYAIMDEAQIPNYATGTAVGIMSVVGYTPDVFMSPLMGYLLDNNPGEAGHQYVFLVLAAFSIVGLAASAGFNKLNLQKA